jgi:hypothetical protein
MSDNNPSAADPFGQIAAEFMEAFRQGKHPSVEESANHPRISKKTMHWGCATRILILIRWLSDPCGTVQ